VCGEGPWCAACVMAMMSEATLERTSGEIGPKNQIWSLVDSPSVLDADILQCMS
jgi:hypothetical protein